MNIRNLIWVLGFVLSIFWQSAIAGIAGGFTLPYATNQAWSLGLPGCTSTGYYPLNDGVPVETGQFYMELNTKLAKYHMGEDWNGKCGGDTDIGGNLRAIADGQVEAINLDAANQKGKYVVVRYTLPDGNSVYSWDLHCDTILVAIGNIVTSGQKIATLGRSGLTPAEGAHLHWEMHKDVSDASPVINSYQQVLSLAVVSNVLPAALKLTATSLFVDDRSSGGTVFQLTPGAWTQFTVSQNAASSPAYIQDQAGNRYSIKKAVEAGIIANYGVTFIGTDGQWHYYLDVTQATFAPGTTYALYAQAPSLNFVVLYPGNHYKGDRSRMDMVRAASQDTRFKSVRTETFGGDLTGDPNWEYRWMGFDFVSNNGSGWTVYMIATTSKTNPLVRFTRFWDPNTGQYSPWVYVGNNVLY